MSISTVYDITLPEVRSTAMAVQYFIESAGAALAPLMAGLIAVRSSLHNAILLICVSTWVLCSIFFGVVAYPAAARCRHPARPVARTRGAGAGATGGGITPILDADTRRGR